MIKNLRRKGFTIVELVIVIAVIAILAAILIPTFSGIIKKANIASDTAMAKNMNTALVMADSEGNNPEDMGDVLFVLFSAGYVLENLNPTTNGYYFVWDEESNQILFLTDKFDVHYSSQPYSADTLNWWMPMDEVGDIIPNQQFSYCMTNNIANDIPEFNYLANFDTNGFTLTGDITYVSTGSGSFSVSGIIEGTLTVDTIHASVSHYGSVNTVDIIAVDSASYHEYGFVKYNLDFKAGRLVVENSGNASIVTIPVSFDGSVLNKGFIKKLASKTAGVINEGYILHTETGDGYSQAEGVNQTQFTLLISTLTQLEAFRDSVNSGMTCKGITVKLMENINISNRYWKPIGLNNRELLIREGEVLGVAGDPATEKGTPANVFMGIFDGNNKTINGLSNAGYIAPAISYTINSSKINGYPYGLFSITYDAEIYRLNMTNVNIISTLDSSFCVGAIVGGVRGGFILKDCSVKGNVEGVDGVGGAVGYVYEVKAKEVPNNIKYVPDEDNGKLIKFDHVVVEGNIYAKTNLHDAKAGQRVGGIIGSVLMLNLFKADYPDGSNQFIMNNCSFKGTVAGDLYRVGGLFANSNSGGWFNANNELAPNAKIEITNNTVEGTIKSLGTIAQIATGDANVGRFLGGLLNNIIPNTYVTYTGNQFISGSKVYVAGSDVTTVNWTGESGTRNN